MVDSHSRQEQKVRDEQAKEERERNEEDRILYESRMIQK